MTDNYHKLEAGMIQHFQDDLDFQAKQEAYHDTLDARIDGMNEKIDNFMKDMSPLLELANAFRGINLLRKPSLWILALTIGIVAFLTGAKTLLAFLANFLRP
jgi:hypothetical protein